MNSTRPPDPWVARIRRKRRRKVLRGLIYALMWIIPGTQPHAVGKGSSGGAPALIFFAGVALFGFWLITGLFGLLLGAYSTKEKIHEIKPPYNPGYPPR